MRQTIMLSSCTGLVLLLGSAGFGERLVHAGGFELAVNGTEALGRGGAFVAKADSPLALEFNVSGLARQRGTRVLFDSNLYFSSYSFQRAEGNPSLVSDRSDQPFFAPFFGIATDFGFFDRLTFAVGAFGPPSVGRRTYNSDGAQRYDIVSTDLLVLQPTLAAAIRLGRFVDLGVALGSAYGRYQLRTTSNIVKNIPMTLPCPNPEDPGCDVETNVQVSSAFNPILSLGLMLHSSAGCDIGLPMRSAPNLSAKSTVATGTLNATYRMPTKIMTGTELEEVEVEEFTADTPWVLRAGVRYVHRKGAREVFDVELDAGYELWSQAQGDGNRLRTDRSPVNPASRLELLSPHHYQDTFNLRLGGAYNQPVGPALLTLRLGTWYDHSASPDAWTRMDFDTLAKVAATGGIGARIRGVTFNLAYAFVYSLPRTVTNGELRPIDGLTGMDLRQLDGTPAPAVNNGRYQGQNHILSLGLTILFDELVRGERWRRGAS